MRDMFGIEVFVRSYAPRRGIVPFQGFELWIFLRSAMPLAIVLCPFGAGVEIDLTTF